VFGVKLLGFERSRQLTTVWNEAGLQHRFLLQNCSPRLKTRAIATSKSSVKSTSYENQPDVELEMRFVWSWRTMGGAAPL
jgi:hypothetical protein